MKRGRDPATRVAVGRSRQRVVQLEARGLTRGQIAQRAGISASTISRITNPATERISRITTDAHKAAML
jgi:DNA-binding NarL/FixJ family response regulator